MWAWLPWLLLATDAVVRRPDGLSFAGLATAAGLVWLAGHPESSFHAFVAAVAFFALRALRAGPRVSGGGWARARPAAVFVGAMTCGVGLAGVAVIPFAEFLLHSADIHQRAGVGSSEPALHGDNAIGLFLPDYWGRPSEVSLRGFFTARAMYAGALPLMLAGVALVLRPTVERIAIAAFGFCAMAVVFGIFPIFEIVAALPVFSSGHNGRLVILYMLCVALLAGWGLDELTGERLPSRRRWWATGVAAVIMLVPIVIVIAGHRTSLSVAGHAVNVALARAEPPVIRDPAVGPVIRGATLILWTAFASAGLALIAVALRRRVPTAALVAAVLLVVAGDLFRAGMGHNPAIDRDVATQPAPGSVRYLQAHRGTRFVSTGNVSPNILAMTYGLYDAAGYDLPVERRYDHLWRTRISPEFPSQVGLFPQTIQLSVPRVTAPRLRTLGLLGVTNVLQPSQDSAASRAGPEPRLQRSGRSRLFQLRRAPARLRRGRSARGGGRRVGAATDDEPGFRRPERGRRRMPRAGTCPWPHGTIRAAAPPGSSATNRARRRSSALQGPGMLRVDRQRIPGLEGEGRRQGRAGRAGRLHLPVACACRPERTGWSSASSPPAGRSRALSA